MGDVLQSTFSSTRAYFCSESLGRILALFPPCIKGAIMLDEWESEILLQCFKEKKSYSQGGSLVAAAGMGSVLLACFVLCSNFGGSLSFFKKSILWKLFSKKMRQRLPSSTKSWFTHPSSLPDDGNIKWWCERASKPHPHGGNLHMSARWNQLNCSTVQAGAAPHERLEGLWRWSRHLQSSSTQAEELRTGAVLLGFVPGKLLKTNSCTKHAIMTAHNLHAEVLLLTNGTWMWVLLDHMYTGGILCVPIRVPYGTIHFGSGIHNWLQIPLSQKAHWVSQEARSLGGLGPSSLSWLGCEDKKG